MQRVKVYRLTSEGQWDDKGTGQVSVEYMEVRNNQKAHSPSAHLQFLSLKELLVLRGYWGGQHSISHLNS